jgi:hypothetical protein
MRKLFQTAFGALFIALGGLMLVMVIRNGAHDGGTGQAIIGPLALVGAGALAISVAQRKPKKW